MPLSKPAAPAVKPTAVTKPVVAAPVAKAGKADVLVAKLTAKSATAIPTTQLFAKGKPRRRTPEAADLLQSAAPAQRATSPKAVARPFNASSRIRLG